MNSRVARLVSTTILLLSSVVIASLSRAQSTAICKFSTFQPPSGYKWASPAGINNHGTIVGAVVSPSGYWRGLRRNPDGSMSTYAYPTVTPKNTWFTDINDSGIEVGYFGLYLHRGFVKSGNQAVTVDYLGPGTDTWLYGINKWGTIVGSYANYGSNPSGFGGFKLKNGKFILLKVPNSTYMRAFGINDNGVVVGRYSKTSLSGFTPFYHGFIFRNNIYHTLDHPAGSGHSGTELKDINNSGVIVGNWLSRDPRIGDYLEHGFIYKNGKFENLAYPGALLTTAMGINNNGAIVGWARTSDFYDIVPFKATCQ
jgi:uncharacterized membrane protein